MSVESSRRSGGGSGHTSSRRTRSADEDSGGGDAIACPQLLCACKIPLCRRLSRTERNPDREYYQCQKVGTAERFVCKTWIWVDLVCEYVEQMVKFRTRNLEQELSAVEKELEQKNELLNQREIETVEQDRAHQNEIAVLVSQLSALQSQLAVSISAASKFRRGRFLVLMLAATCWILAPCSLVIAIFASTIVVFMYLV